MELKKNYSAREVAALTGLTARQLQWWDASGLLSPTVAPRRTEAGGYTERRYSPVELIELMVLADLRRHGLSVRSIRRLLATLRDRFDARLFDTIGDGGALTLLTDGSDVYGRTRTGELFNLLKAPDQPLLEVGAEPKLRQLRARAKRRRRRAAARRA
ncbi:MAG TPA: MerR family transcriptional regulator [Vicinamibacterales bacterium]|nr:MerR family transcriptional regulator [Vicinamibacterales bacterium]